MKILIRRYNNKNTEKESRNFVVEMAKSFIDNMLNDEPVTVYNSRTGKDETYYPSKNKELALKQ